MFRRGKTTCYTWMDGLNTCFKSGTGSSFSSFESSSHNSTCRAASYCGPYSTGNTSCKWLLVFYLEEVLIRLSLTGNLLASVWPGRNMLSQLDLSAGSQQVQWKWTLLFSPLHRCPATNMIHFIIIIIIIVHVWIIIMSPQLFSNVCAFSVLTSVFAEVIGSLSK